MAQKEQAGCHEALETIALRRENQMRDARFAVKTIAINGKFLSPTAGRSGVYRVAHELVLALDSLLEANPALAAVVSCRVISPNRISNGMQLSKIEIVPSHRLCARMSGTAWEQLVLPWMARGSTLLNLCNVGPLLHRDAFTMVHDAQVHSSPASYSRMFALWYRLVQPVLGRLNNALLTVSRYSRDELVHYGVARASRVHVIHNGCDHVLRLAPDESVVQKAGLSGKRYVVALANTQAHKNIRILLEAFRSAELREVTLALFGSATKEDFERLGHEVPPNVLFVGRVSDEELCGLLKQAVALAFPSLTEGFGLPPLEAMALGCPTIVAPCGALPEICGDAALWADPRDAATWVRHIATLCSQPEHVAEVATRGRAHAAHFTWENAARQLLESVLGHSAMNIGLKSSLSNPRPHQTPGGSFQ